MSLTLTCNLQPRNQGIRIDAASNETAMNWPVPKGTKGSVLKITENEILVTLTWSSTGLKDLYSYATSNIWVKREMMGSLFNY